MKREAKWQTIWSKYCQECAKRGEHWNYELKQTKTDSFYFNSFEPQQIPSLIATENSGFHWKYSDADPRVKMFDGSIVPAQKGYVVIKYPDCFVMIRVGDFVKEDLESSMLTKPIKSLSLQRAKDIAERIIRI